MSVQSPDYRGIPAHMREGMQAYIEYGRPPGSFLTAILCNDFMTAASRADNYNAQALFAYCYFLYNHAPAQCHSSESNFKYWLEVGGLRGLAAKAAAAAADEAESGQRENPRDARETEPSGVHVGSTAVPNVVQMFDNVLRPATDTGD